MSTITLIALLVVAFSAGGALGILVTAACAAGSREDAFRRGYLRGLHSDDQSQVSHPHEEALR